jgi:hypothetical protein
MTSAGVAREGVSPKVDRAGTSTRCSCHFPPHVIPGLDPGILGRFPPTQVRGGEGSAWALAQFTIGFPIDPLVSVSVSVPVSADANPTRLMNSDR